MVQSKVVPLPAGQTTLVHNSVSGAQLTLVTPTINIYLGGSDVNAANGLSFLDSGVRIIQVLLLAGESLFAFSPATGSIEVLITAGN
jgi:hypothetical protein